MAANPAAEVVSSSGCPPSAFSAAMVDLGGVLLLGVLPLWPREADRLLCPLCLSLVFLLALISSLVASPLLTGVRSWAALLCLSASGDPFALHMEQFRFCALHGCWWWAPHL